MGCYFVIKNDFFIDCICIINGNQPSTASNPQGC